MKHNGRRFAAREFRIDIPTCTVTGTPCQIEYRASSGKKSMGDVHVCGLEKRSQGRVMISKRMVTVEDRHLQLE